MIPNARPGPTAIVAALTLSWLGLYLHNLQELALPVWRPENSVPLLVVVVLAATWWRRPSRRAALLLVAWALLQLGIGAVLSVLPLGVFPFEPEQTSSHYGSHLLYAVLQAPLLVGALRSERGYRDGHTATLPWSK